LVVAPVHSTIVLSTGDAGVHAASARSNGATSAINGASAVACRSSKWRRANNFISISKIRSISALIVHVPTAREICVLGTWETAVRFHSILGGGLF
jgi:hypothetical protein